MYRSILTYPTADWRWVSHSNLPPSGAMYNVLSDDTYSRWGFLLAGVTSTYTLSMHVFEATWVVFPSAYDYNDVQNIEREKCNVCFNEVIQKPKNKHENLHRT